MSIKILSDDVVNQIAAGEVVERPAHLIKELIENALDAKATQIDIELIDGIEHMLVTDNGLGIAPRDLPIALLRHSTSKISETNDLWALASYGFRGEALASISAVSELSVSSRTKDFEFATKVTSEFGKIGQSNQVGHPIGTQIRVKNLFHNVPARLKFLKSLPSEIGQIRQVIRAMALVTPHVGWRFIVNNRADLYFASTDELKRAQDVLGVKQLYASYENLNSYRVTLFGSSPHETIKTAKNIWIFVQNRWVQDRALNAALLEGYRNYLMHHEYPFAVVKLEIPPEQLDVNIHPTKSLVKFQDSSLAFRSVVHACRKLMEQAPWSPSSSLSDLENKTNVKLSTESEKDNTYTQTKLDNNYFEKILYPNKLNASDWKSLGQQRRTDYGVVELAESGELTAQKELSGLGELIAQRELSTATTATATSTVTATATTAQRDDLSGQVRLTQLNQYGERQDDLDFFQNQNLLIEPNLSQVESITWNKNLTHIENSTTLSEKSPQGYQATSDHKPASNRFWQNLQIVGQVGLTYIIAQSADKMYLIDQHAAHERVRFETIKKSMSASRIEMQILLIPLIIDFRAEKKEALLNLSSRLAQMGLVIEDLGPSSLGVTQKAPWIVEEKLPSMLDQLADQVLDQGDSYLFDQWADQLIATQACHSAIRAGTALTTEGVKNLLSQMDEFPQSSFCPHGRPVWIEYSFAELEKDFGRRV